MKKLLLLLCIACSSANAQTATDKTAIGNVLDNWHKAAAQAKSDTYFGLMTDDARFIGTDATENWSVPEFKAFAKPYFDTGRAWDFKAVERNIFFSSDAKTAWFDELLDTWMKICRGSGVMQKQKDGSWKIAHYVLSITIPNDNSLEVIKIKQAFDDAFLTKLKAKP
ncbi:MAG TPA: nuclear transport factor 2 family protein [Flavobacterium sp.]|jgi:ketosteroid isomerase-like protein